MYKNDDVAIDTFFTNFVPVNPYDFDEADYQQKFYGSYLVFTESETRTWDLYYLGYDNDNPASQVAGQRDFSLHTVGDRVNGKKDVWLYEAEGGGQFGRQSGLGVDHSAAFGTIGVGKELAVAWSPTLWLYYDYASGNVPGGDFNRFNHLFPLGHKYIGFIDSRSIQHFEPQRIFDHEAQQENRAATMVLLHWRQPSGRHYSGSWFSISAEPHQQRFRQRARPDRQVQF